jgi:AcrR family transcriptional regulator
MTRSTRGPVASGKDDQQERILQAAADLLAEVGPTGLSTRAVAAAAGVQTPTLYRLFTDKDGLLDAVASYGFETYLAEKRAFSPTKDAVDDLRRGWDIHVEFGLTNPAIYALMYGNLRLGQRPAAAEENHEILRRMLDRANSQGRLRVPVEAAARAIEASTTGGVLLLLAQPESQRDPRSIRPLRDTVLDSVTIESAHGTDPTVITSARADALLAALSLHGGIEPLARDLFSAAEASLLREWLTKLVDAQADRAGTSPEASAPRAGDH